MTHAEYSTLTTTTTTLGYRVTTATLLRLTDAGRRPGIRQRPRRRQDPRVCAEQFQRVFEATYGVQHPTFFEGSYTQVGAYE